MRAILSTKQGIVRICAFPFNIECTLKYILDGSGRTSTASHSVKITPCVQPDAKEKRFDYAGGRTSTTSHSVKKYNL